LIRDRVEWHGSMMFYPCFVTIAQCFYNFSALFTLLPYFANDGRCSGTTIGDVFASINSAGWLVCVSNVSPAPRPVPGTCALCTRVEFSKRRLRRQAVLFMVAMASLLFLCMLHFVQFQRYQALQDL